MSLTKTFVSESEDKEALSHRYKYKYKIILVRTKRNIIDIYLNPDLVRLK